MGGFSCLKCLLMLLVNAGFALKINCKYERLQRDLISEGFGKMKAFGSSMTPILKSGVTLSFVKCPTYKIGDIVFCKVKGRYIDAHKLTKIDLSKGYLISNNHGLDNGWTKTIYGKVIEGHYMNKLTYKSKDKE